jgi:hypothetical protein
MAAAPRDWSGPFLEQAREDLRAAWAIPADQSPSTLCVLIQMVFEKLGKAAFSRSGQKVPKKHQIASRLFAILLRHPEGTALLQAHPSVEQFILELEVAHPSVAGQQSPPCPQLEYPWEDVRNDLICYPARDLPLARRVQDPRDRIAVDCLKFASALEKQLDSLDP